MGSYPIGGGILINGLLFLSPKEALPLLENDAILVDLRAGLERNGRTFVLENLIILPYAELEEKYSMLPSDKLLILADCVGINSKSAIRFLKEHGYGNVASLNGGMVEWERDGMPTAIDHDEELAGGCACRLRPSKFYKPLGSS